MCDDMAVSYFYVWCMREGKAKVWNVDANLKINGVSWAVVTGLFTDNTVLIVENEKEIQKVVDNCIVYVGEGS